jgi:predicted MFS family arabinose efflux permease
MLVITVTAVMSSLGNPLIPQVAADHDVPLGRAQWVTTGALLAAAVATPVLGRIGTGPRRRPVVLAVLALGVLGGLLTALPLGFTALIAGRVLQGVGMALAPVAIAVARDVVPPHRQASAIAWLSVASVTGAGLGFPLTGVAADHLGATGAFWMGTAFSGLTLLAALAGFPAGDRGRAAPVDWFGAALLGGSTLGLLLFLAQGGSWGWSSAAALATLLASVALLAGCAAWLLRRDHPLVDLRLAVAPGVVGPNVAGTVLCCGMFALFSLVALVVQHEPAHGVGLGGSVLVSGLMFTPYGLMSVVGSRLALRAGRRVSPDLLLPLGTAWFAAALVLLAAFHATLTQVVLVMVVAGLGSGFSLGVIPGVLLRHVPQAEAGSALSVNHVLRYLGYAAGSALAVASLELFADRTGDITDRGVTATALAGAGLCTVALVASAALAPRAGYRPPTGTQQTETRQTDTVEDLR